MKNTLKITLAAGLCALGLGGAASAQNVALNPGFEATCSGFDGWTSFGNVSVADFYTTSGVRGAKMFGPFNGGFGYSGVWQDTPVVAGQQWEASINVTNPFWDAASWNPGPPEAGTRFFAKIDFFDGSGNIMNDDRQFRSDYLEAPTGDTSITLTVPPATVPAGAVRASLVLLVEQAGNVGGACWIDDAVLRQVGGSNVLTNPSFESLPAGCIGSGYRYWANFGNGQANLGENARSGNNAAKLFGGFNGPIAYSGWFQDVPASEGEQFKATGWGRSSTSDSLGTDNEVTLRIEYWDNGGNITPGEFKSDPVPTPGDNTYRFFETPVTDPAPAGTTKARILVLQIQLNFAGGATWWDDMTLEQIGGNNCPADFNSDGFVDDTDFVLFAQAYDQFTVPPASAACDLNGDTFVDDTDFVLFAQAYDVFTCP